MSCVIDLYYVQSAAGGYVDLQTANIGRHWPLKFNRRSLFASSIKVNFASQC